MPPLGFLTGFTFFLISSIKKPMPESPFPYIEKCLKNEEGAWRQFFKEYWSIAHNILRGRFNRLSLQDNEDIIQNVFKKLIKGGLANFRGTSKYEFLKYFKTIVINEGIDYLDIRRKHGEDVLSNKREDEGSDYEESDPSPSPSEEVERNQIIDLVEKHLAQFPLVDREVFVMKVNGYKDREIGEILKISIGTVASKYSRLREKLSEALRKNGISPEE
jgi:RNA polymerase sigma factor (sigma-70 family)